MERLSLSKWLGVAAYVICGLLILVFVAPLFGWKALTVLTPSMKPGISPGDLVIIHRVPQASIHPGNIITYQDPHKAGVTITHRVITVRTVDGVPSYITKGDANAVADPPVAAGQVVGREALVIPGIGRLLDVTRTPLGLLVLVIVPALYVIWTEFKNLKRLLGEPKRQPTRRLDGVYRLMAILVAAALVVSLGRGTFAQLVSAASLTGNSVTAQASTSPTPTPTSTPSPTQSACPSVSITNTGPGSTNIVTCHQSNSVTTRNHSSVSITNQSYQSATSGGINIQNNTNSSSGATGSSNNNSSSSTSVQISN